MANFKDPQEIKLIEETVEELRNSEQFDSLVWMHLSFLLNLETVVESKPTEKDDGLLKKLDFLRITKKSSVLTKSQVRSSLKIEGLKKLIRFIGLEENISQEGIFRKAGVVTRQKALKEELLDKGAGFSLGHENVENGYTAHDCANVLKSFLAEFNEPLLTDMYYSVYCQLADLAKSLDRQDDRILSALQLLMLLLPEGSSTLFRPIIELLHRVTRYEATNKMSAKNLAIMFTPHLVCPRNLDPEMLNKTSQQMFGIIEFMIQSGQKLFEIPEKLAADIKVYFIDESATSNLATNTIFSFVDRAKMAEVDSTTYTEKSLEKLHAHVQTMPESGQKKKFLKNYEREYGNKK